MLLFSPAPLFLLPPTAPPPRQQVRLAPPVTMLVLL